MENRRYCRKYWWNLIDVWLTHRGTPAPSAGCKESSRVLLALENHNDLRTVRASYSVLTPLSPAEDRGMQDK